MDARRQSARAESYRAYVAALRDLSDKALAREYGILAHTPELRDALEAETERRRPRRLAASA
jgi:hypothetical protein